MRDRHRPSPAADLSGQLRDWQGEPGACQPVEVDSAVARALDHNTHRVTARGATVRLGPEQVVAAQKATPAEEEVIVYKAAAARQQLPGQAGERAGLSVGWCHARRRERLPRPRPRSRAHPVLPDEPGRGAQPVAGRPVSRHRALSATCGVGSAGCGAEPSPVRQAGAVWRWSGSCSTAALALSEATGAPTRLVMRLPGRSPLARQPPVNRAGTPGWAVDRPSSTSSPRR